MITKYTLAWLSICFAFSCCSKEGGSEHENHRLKGQIFIVQQNRVNIPLGAVDVHWVSADDFKKRCAWIGEERARMQEVLKYVENLKKIDSWLTRLKTGDNALQLSPFIREASELQAKSWKILKRNPLLDKLLTLEEFRESNQGLFEGSGLADDIHSQWIATAIFFDWLDRTSARSTTTNANGEFDFSVPHEHPGFLLARASRSLPDSGFENYYWISEVQGNEVDPINLPSKLLVTPLFLYQLERSYSEPRKTSQDLIIKEFDLVDPEWFTEGRHLWKKFLSVDNEIQALQFRVSELEDRMREIRTESSP